MLACGTNGWVCVFGCYFYLSTPGAVRESRQTTVMPCKCQDMIIDTLYRRAPNMLYHCMLYATYLNTNNPQLSGHCTSPKSLIILDTKRLQKSKSHVSLILLIQHMVVEVQISWECDTIRTTTLKCPICPNCMMVSHIGPTLSCRNPHLEFNHIEITNGFIHPYCLIV